MVDNKCEIVVNDVLEELNEENKRLLEELLFANKCLKVLNEFKNFVELNSNQFKLILDENNKQFYEELSENVKQVLDQKRCHSKISNDKNRIEVKRKDNCFNDNESEEIMSKKNKKKSRNTGKISSDSLLCEWPGCQYMTTARDRTGHREALRKHSVVHSEKKFVCCYRDCHYKTYKRSSLNGHIRRHEKKEILKKHTIERPFVCQTCGKAYAINSLLTAHIKIMHTNFDKPVVCGIDDCDKRFESEVCLRKHQNICHFLCFICDYCDYKTGIKSQLMKHKIQNHTNDMPFKCHFERCDKTFKLEEQYNCHLKSHSTTLLTCPYDSCDKTYYNDYSLTQHIEIEHIKNEHLVFV